MSILSDPIFHNEQAAYAYVETILWPHGPVENGGAIIPQ